MDIKKYFMHMENCSDEDLEQLIAYIKGVLSHRQILDSTYEDEFIDVMQKCGLDSFHAEMSLLDFKSVSAVYMQKTEPLFIEDIWQVLDIVLRKNGYVPDGETNKMLNGFLIHSFGKNIPLMSKEMSG